MAKLIFRIMPLPLLILGVCLLAGGQGATTGTAGPLDWPEPAMENRPGCYWWWPGSAVDEENITWNLETMRAAGMGGATIVPIYGVKGYEDRYIQHLTPDWVDMMSHAAREARRLGMWVDMTTGTGWPFGGPMISDDDSDAIVVYENGVLSHQFSGRMVKRAAPGGEGKAINPYSARAMSEYLQHFDRAFAGSDVVMPRAMYHDSFEFKGNWSKDFPQEFKKRRGYDLADHLPALFGEGDAENVGRIKSDYRETLSDLHLEYLQTWVSWSRRYGTTTRNQAHGAPANLLDLYAASGIPETETFGATAFKIPGIRRRADNIRQVDNPQPLINRMASSAAHVTGKTLIASESCTWIRNHFRTALSQVKPEIDQLFLNGINHVFFHGTCYSPKDAPWPGWLFYASLEYNPRNAIWRDAGFLNDYITRCQSILQSGSPDNDVALYWPVYDLWHSPEGMQQMLTVHHAEWLTRSTLGLTSAWLKEKGFGFDYISDRQLLADQAKPYRAVIVPRTEHMPLATLKKLLKIADSGQPVMFLDALPADVPGFFNLPDRQAELKTLLDGREDLVVDTRQLLSRLAKTEVAREPLVEAGLDFIRRTHEQGHHYFLANLGDKAVDSWIPLGKPFKSAVIMDPLTANVGVASQRQSRELYLQLLPGETRIIRTFKDELVEGPIWPILGKAGFEPVTVNGDWQVTFVEGGPKLPASFSTSELGSWVEMADEEARRFAGTARYSTEFELPDTEADDWMIDLGDVRESARVFINGKMAAALWSVPYRARVGNYFKPGRNRLEIEVTNLSANRIRELDIRKVNWKIFHDINFVDQNYQKFDASKWPLTPSGLLGPVRLFAMKRFDP
jgi:hypothetical protein